MKRIFAKFSGVCRRCRCRIRKNDLVGFDPVRRGVYCSSCADNLDDAPTLDPKSMTRAERLAEAGFDRWSEVDD